MLPRTMMDLHLRYASSELARNGRKISVHAGAQLEGFDRSGSIDLQGAAIVVKPYARHDAEQPVRNRRREIPREEVVLPLPAPSRDDVLPACERKHLRNIARIVLQVTVERDNELATGFGKSCCKGGGLSEVACEANDLHVSVLLLHGGELLERRICAPIVDQEYLVRDAELIEYTGELVV